MLRPIYPIRKKANEISVIGLAYNKHYRKLCVRSWLWFSAAPGCSITPAMRNLARPRSGFHGSGRRSGRRRTGPIGSSRAHANPLLRSDSPIGRHVIEGAAGASSPETREGARGCRHNRAIGTDALDADARRRPPERASAHRAMEPGSRRSPDHVGRAHCNTWRRAHLDRQGQQGRAAVGGAAGEPECGEDCSAGGDVHLGSFRHEGDG